MLLARRFAPLFLSLSRLSCWLMVASLGAISFSLSFNGRVNGSINLPIVVLKALEAPGAPAIAMKETSDIGDGHFAVCAQFDTRHASAKDRWAHADCPRAAVELLAAAAKEPHRALEHRHKKPRDV